MIMYTDRDFKSTKRIKQGLKRLRAPFDALAKWIASKRKVTVLNVIYHRATSWCSPRLEVVLEHPCQERQFHRGFNYDRRRQKAIANKFIELNGQDGAPVFDVEGLFVVFSSFSQIANRETDHQIPDAHIKALKKRIGNPDLWCIDRCLGSVTFFFFTEEQKKKHEALGKKREYANMYFDILKPHDEFGYLKRSNFTVRFDSKQNFDDHYESNWYYYYR